MKKILSVLLMALCIFCLFSGCKKSENEVMVQPEEISNTDTVQNEDTSETDKTQPEETYNIDTKNTSDELDLKDGSNALKSDDEAKTEDEDALKGSELASLTEIKDDADSGVILLPLQTEVEYNPDDYPDLAKKGTMSGYDIDCMEEGISDYLYYSSEQFYDKIDGCPSSYKDSVYQYYLCVDDSPIQVVSVDISNGNERMDAIMKGVGYQIYHLTYYYPYGLFDTSEMDMIKPLSISLEVKGTQYQYEINDDELVRRYEEEKYSDNPTTNDFLNNLYKIGCYYGNVLVGEKDDYIAVEE